MSRSVVFSNGEFQVSDDPDGVIATVLSVATNNVNHERIAEQLAPEGRGFSLDRFGAVWRATCREDLPPPWDQEPALDPEHEELWVLVRDANPSRDQDVAHAILSGDEVRELAARANQLRANERSSAW